MLRASRLSKPLELYGPDLERELPEILSMNA